METYSKNKSGGSGGGLYFFGMIGALIYFLQNAATFSEGLLGILKSIVWPAVLVYSSLKTLGV